MAANSEKQQKKRGRGRPFVKGQSGNPSGKPAGYAAYREKCREYTDAALAALAADLDLVDKRAFAAKTLLENGWGRPAQAVDIGEGAKRVSSSSTWGSDEESTARGRRVRLMLDRYRPPPTLRLFLRSNAFVRAVVGPVGSGKSSACVNEILRRSLEQAPFEGVRRTRWAIIRNTYPELRDTTRKTFEQWPLAQLGTFHEQSFAFTAAFDLDDGTRVETEILFRALDRPEHVKKLLSLELTGAYINEARECPKLIFEGLQTRVGRFPAKAQGGPSWFGIWLDTNPWHTGHWGYKLFTEEKPEGHELFEQPGGREPNAENVENLPPGYYDRLVIGKDGEWISEYVDGKYPSNDRGSIYGHLITALKARGGLDAFDHPSDGIFTFFDFGISDATAIWFFRFSKGLDVVDHYEAHGVALSHYFQVLDQRAEDRGYKYLKHWLPHDGAARTLQTGVSIQDQFATRYGRNLVSIGPPLSVEDGIAASRWVLEQPATRIHPRCSEVNGASDIDGIDALRSYRYEYDLANRVYTKRPLHDWSSHTADAWRGLSIVAKVSGFLVAEKPAPKPRVIGTIADTTLDELWADNQPDPGGRRI